MIPADKKPGGGIRPAHPDAQLIRSLLANAGGCDHHRRMRLVMRELRTLGRNDLVELVEKLKQ